MLIDGLSPLEAAGCLTGIVAVWLTTRQDRWCWPLSLINVAIYAVVFGEARLYADMGLQAVYAALAVYGWWHWLHGGRDGGELTVGRTPRRAAIGLAAVGLFGAAGLGALLSGGTDARVPYWDSATTAVSLVAQAMMTRKWVENWIVWIVVDVALVAKYSYSGLFPTAALYSVYLGLATWGFVSWRRSLRVGTAR